MTGSRESGVTNGTEFLSLPAAAVLPQQPSTVTTLELGNSSTTGIDMSKFLRAMAVGHIGAAVNHSVTAYFLCSPTVSGTYSPFGSTTFTTTTQNQDFTLECRSDQLPASARYLQLLIAINNATPTFVCADVLCSPSGYHPASQFDGSSTTGITGYGVIANRSVM